MDKLNQSNILLYSDGELELDVSINDDTVWLNRHQISELFGRDLKTIGKHIGNVFRDKELEKISVVANFATTARDGKIYNVEYYSLDVIISVGYRVKSQKGVRFRQWATRVLKHYILDGYAINSEKITNQRFKELENEVMLLKSTVSNISNSLENTTLQPKQGIFYDGQMFDAYAFVSGLVKKANTSITLIDNYCDETTLTHLSKADPKVKITLLTQTISKQLKLDIAKYNTQYKNLEAKEFKSSHDRFLIIDNKEVYHIGASLKDLGKKWFAFSLMEVQSFEAMERISKPLGGSNGKK